MAAITGAILSGVMELPQIINGITGLIHGVEHLFGKGNGQAKKAAVIEMFKAGISAYDGTVQAISETKFGSSLPQINDEAFQAALSKLIDATVAFANVAGTFKTSKAIAA